MSGYQEYKEMASNDETAQMRAEFLNSYVYIIKECQRLGKRESVCHENIAKVLDLTSIHKDVLNLVRLDYVRSNSFNFKPTDSIINATDYLRNFNPADPGSIRDKYEYNKNVLKILKQIRDNAMHYGKFELENPQFDRNRMLFQYSCAITNHIIDELSKIKTAE